MEMRLRGGFPRANAVKYVKEKHGVNMLGLYLRHRPGRLRSPVWNTGFPGVEVTGVHELVGNALVMKGEKTRETDLRGAPLQEGRRSVNMYDARKIFIGLLIFLVLLTFPFWYGKGRAVPSLQLKIDTPEIPGWRRRSASNRPRT